MRIIEIYGMLATVQAELLCTHSKIEGIEESLRKTDDFIGNAMTTLKDALAYRVTPEE